MRKTCISFLLISIIIVLAVVGRAQEKPETNTEYLRIHIRANSNDAVDQNVKYLVKDEIVEYLTPIIAGCDSKDEAISSIKQNVDAINRLIDSFLQKNGFNYKSSLAIRKEHFPTRCYGDLTLEEGDYDAVIVNLGSGKGDNWWCVVFPPLCFTDSKNVKYKSAIKEIIDNFKLKYKEIK
ncbi:MAG: stage II sporulation protein R [Christensenellaceae bacterium]